MENKNKTDIRDFPRSGINAIVNSFQISKNNICIPQKMISIPNRWESATLS